MHFNMFLSPRMCNDILVLYFYTAFEKIVILQVNFRYMSLRCRPVSCSRMPTGGHWGLNPELGVKGITTILSCKYLG